MPARAKLRAVDTATKYHPVMAALAEAQAAAWLLGELQWGGLACDLGAGPVPVQPDPALPLPSKELHEWLTMMASDALHDALARAKAEFITSQTATPADRGA